MKKFLLIALFMAIPFFGSSQIFQENFDGSGPGFAAWTLIDVDGLPHHSNASEFNAGAWIRKDRGGPAPNYGGPDGDFAVMSSSWYNPAGTSNDWLISPQITLPAATAFLKWDAKAQDAQYRDGYKVMLSPNGGNTVADFTVQLFTIPSENSTWTTRTVSLAAYAGTNVRIAFVNNSNDMFVLLMDNISIQLIPTAPPNCATLTSPANGATGINYKTPLALTWNAPTTGAAVSSYDVYFGTAANPTTLLTNTTTLTTTIPITQMTSATTYYWKVVPKNELGPATGCTDFTFTTANPPAAAPNCATLNTPSDAASAVDYITTINLTWTAPTTGTVVDSYDVYMDTNPNPTTLLGNKTTTSHTIAAGTLSPSTKYYWKVVPKNDTGSATGCTVFSFTTKANPFTPYCGPVPFTFTVEPITLVNFAGINNNTSAATAGATQHEDFISLTPGSVTAGNSYPITLKGNTNGNYTSKFVVFIDWNQNGVLNDAGEVYDITQTITNSTGTDAVQATQTLAVPTTALGGNTRMRVKKIFGTTDLLDPCKGGSFGQAEDYTLSVSSLAVNDVAKNATKVYPNPVVDVMNVESVSKVKSLSVYDLSGKVVSSHVINAVKSQANLSKLAPGVYIVNIETENGTQSVKIVKK